MSDFKWDADSTAKAIDLWKSRDESENSRKVAAKIAEEIIGSEDAWRRVVAKLTTEKLYVAPVKEKAAKEKEPVLLKSEIVKAIEDQTNFSLGTMSNGTIADLTRFAEFHQVELPEPKVR